MRPSRAIQPIGHKLGVVLGRAGEKDVQRRVLLEALKQLEQHHPPGAIIEFQP